jgi:transcription antitermination factor NusG
MPILAREPEIYPPTLFADPADSREWFVAHTKPRQEKALARKLHDANVPYFAPTTPRRSLIRGRIVTSRVPVFPGYAFFRGAVSDRGKILSTGRVANILAVPDQAALWTDLRQVNAVLGTGEPVVPDVRLLPGATVRVRFGPLAGLSGTIVRTATGRRFVVAVSFLNRGLAVEIDDKHLTRIGGKTGV